MQVTINYKTFSDAEYVCCAETEIRGERHFGIGKDWEGAKAHLMKKLNGVLGQDVPPPETVEIKVAGEEMDTDFELFAGREIEAETLAMIKISIAVNKVDKSKFFVKKNGDKMLDMVLIETPKSKYDQDYMIVQDSSKEDRDAGKKGAILGNGKIIESKGNRGNGKPAAAKEDSNEDW